MEDISDQNCPGTEYNTKSAKRAQSVAANPRKTTAAKAAPETCLSVEAPLVGVVSSALSVAEAESESGPEPEPEPEPELESEPPVELAPPVEVELSEVLDEESEVLVDEDEDEVDEEPVSMDI